MQRINWFPDPNITGTLATVEGGNNAKIEYPTANNRKWLRATSVAAGDSYGQYTLLESRLPPAGTYHVHALTYAQKATADFQIYARADGTYRMLLDVPVGDDMTITIDQNITIPSNTDQLLVRIALDQKTVGAKGMMSDILIERADTYGTAVGGGASGLLHGGYDAARIGAFVGRVMSDDGDELAPASESGHPTHNMEQCGRHRERGRNPNLPCECRKGHFESFFEDVRWHVRAWYGHLRRQVQGTARKPRHLWLHRRAQRRKGWCLGVPDLQAELLESVFQLAKRRADPDRVGDLHVRRLGEIAVNGSDVVRRGYDAARLTLLGVVA